MTTTRKLIAVRVDLDIIDGLKRVTERDGVPQSVQIRRALLAWLKSRKALPKTTTKRTTTTKGV